MVYVSPGSFHEMEDASLSADMSGNITISVNVKKLVALLPKGEL